MRERERESEQSDNAESNEIDIGVCKREGFIDRGTGKHQSNEVYSTDIARTLTHSDYKNPMKIIDEEKIL